MATTRTTAKALWKRVPQNQLNFHLQRLPEPLLNFHQTKSDAATPYLRVHSFTSLNVGPPRSNRSEASKPRSSGCIHTSNNQADQTREFRTSAARALKVRESSAESLETRELVDASFAGSGFAKQQLRSNLCAHHSSDESSCARSGTVVCPNCNLVSYCSHLCRCEHWEAHRDDCAASQTILKPPPPEGLDPQKQTEDVALKATEWFWGNIPAYGLLDDGPVENLPEHARVCFAASGDLRNVIETVCQLPDAFRGSLTLYCNDHNPRISARNLLMLEVLRRHGRTAIDLVVALWCSVSLTPPQASLLNAIGTTLYIDTKNQSGIPEAARFLGQGGSTLVAKFSTEVWRTLVSISLPQTDAECPLQSLRKCFSDSTDAGLTLFLKRKLGCLRPPHRVAWRDYVRHGIVLPFGAEKRDHTVLNPYFVDSSVGGMLANAGSPLDAFDPVQLLAVGRNRGLPSMDIFGHLFFHLRERLSTFLGKLETCQVHLRLFCCKASTLAKKLGDHETKLHRVDTSNISDDNYQGIAGVLRDWGPLLDRGAPNSALITLFMNWPLHQPLLQHHVSTSRLTHDDFRAAFTAITERDKGDAGFGDLLARGLQYGDLTLVRYFHDSSAAFLEYLDARSADAVAESVGLRRRAAHSVVPHRLFAGKGAPITATPGDASSSELSYYQAVVHNHTFTERFSEWEPVG